ncbi:ssDNA binding protein Ssb3 [Coccidioides immitis RS]|uniref:SsDNA binding protein Ssb3 n=7 Tax=Coccidioides TaxID=5500 RepID=J3K218_COCIM|nr:ssDNA binding protein Ssb3 [Coccidioides immitis RS]XP_003067229.1 hypothetical protein CPC735_016850 [Coccidioides posadasii C735 delta SOWgp]EFW19454.1 ssDNA binding protein Ssb3 [Coccidioides posadasii str. Silveira]TPX20749.1 hypothetical protein DIZ76_016644 [Coccidioides immitis]EAS28089.3 ssDNA binding protein Ssb3 [Coccidioides immitis RS]EER25084.1 hypothetical protein CPC735_016850 [Coccidioides posadasii C735 delta SOWgp]|eukprot:XP_003067229.1 hypothetical protein CPC735_016850 [Coccidioides posadasii C735 delta SOWgp]
MALTTPRILPEHLHAFLPSATNRTPNPVRIFGSVAKLHGETATLSCPDHGQVTLLLNRDSHLQIGRMVDVVGKVVEHEGETAIRVLGAADCGEPNDFDYKIYERVVEMTHRFKNIFYTPNS